MRARDILPLAALFVPLGCTKPVRDTPIPPPSVAGQDAGATTMVYCRAMKSNGDVMAGTKALHEGDAVSRNQWLDLAPNSMIIVKEAGTGREVRVSGPGRARVCVGKDMQTWLISGYFDALTMGAEPASSQRILATPYGAVRFGAARIRATVKTDGTDLEVDAGTVEVVSEHMRPVAGAATPKSDAGGGSPKRDGGAPGKKAPYLPDAVGAGERLKLYGTSDLSATWCNSATSDLQGITLKMTAAALAPGPTAAPPTTAAPLPLAPGSAAAAGPFGSLAEEMTRTENARRISCAWAYAARGGLHGTGVLDGGISPGSRAFKPLPEDPDMPKD